MALLITPLTVISDSTDTWVWIKGTNIISQNGTYGTQGVPAAANTPGARSFAGGSWTDGLGALWLFGGVGYPAGGTNSGLLNDLWKFDPATTNWTWMKGSTNISQNGTYGTIGVADPANTPGARYSAASGMDASGALWLFGGNGYPASGSSGYLVDLWKYTIGGGISLDTNALVFSATFQGANPAAQMIGMTNVGGSAFTYTNVITYGAGASGWLTVLPADGTVALNGATVLTNQVNIAGLDPGTYYATNQVTADATNSPQTVVITLTVNKADQTIAFPDIPDQIVTNVVGLSATASSGLPVTFATNGGPATITGGTNLIFTGTGLVSIVASQAGDGNWNAAPSVTNSLTVSWRRSVGYTHYADVDMDGDRKMDLVIFDPVTGTWSAKLSSFGYAVVSALLGGPACTLVPGDYDGDTKTDPGVYEELTGLWTVMLSSMGYGIATATLGGMGYAPVPSDFDGDRKTDLGVYLSATGGWTVKLSASGYAEAGTTFGGSDYLPVQRDYDGDGKADPAIYHLTTGNWSVMLSGSGYGIASALGFGGAGYAPVPGDYDGDRLNDPAIYHESTGTWSIMLSASGYPIASATLGGSGYAALPGDYDGDGKTDPAVYNTSTGDWYVMLSGIGYGIVTATFGGDGYDPVGFGPVQGQGNWQSTE